MGVMRNILDYEHWWEDQSIILSCGLMKERERIKNWKNKFLSQVGREIFSKAVLQAIPVYTMSFEYQEFYVKRLQQRWLDTGGVQMSKSIKFVGIKWWHQKAMEAWGLGI